MSIKMTRPLTNDFNAITGEYTSQEMNDAELAQYEADNAKALAEIEAAEAEALAKSEAKASAQAKLTALGLTLEEIAALN
jgi:hypothetical protein